MDIQALKKILLQHVWILQVGTRQNTVMFLADGRLAGVLVSEQEHHWELNQKTLSIFSQDGKLAHTLQYIKENPATFSGQTTFFDTTFDTSLTNTSNPSGASHYREVANDRILMESRLGASRDFLLVTFNSLGRPFSGTQNVWEMYHLPDQLSTDYIRFSATKQPRTWYSDKIDRVYPILKSTVLMGYQRIALTGISAGGYAAIFFAEMLAGEFPNLELHTFSINPTLLVGEKHYQEMIQFNMPTRAGLPISPLSREDGEDIDLDDLLAKSTCTNLRHEIHYDSLNPFEVFQISKLKHKENISLVPWNLGLSHIEASAKIYESGSIQHAIGELLPPLYPK